MERERLGRYELVAHLATGGMGRVCVARMEGEGGFERHVLIKSLDLVGTDDEEAQAMFLDEARILGMLHHQHVASIQEVSRDQDGVLFLVLDYVHGHTAHDIWERALDLDVQLPLDFTLSIIGAAASGLHYAHTKRSPDGNRLHIVHRDVTLSNIIVGFDGTIKVIDFGIAKAAQRSTRTQAGYVKGKLGYMAPEQLRGLAVDPRTDVFALGIVLYELTTMRRAFREESDRATIDRIKAGKYIRPSELVHDYPRDLEAIIMKALRLDPKERYQDMDQMRREVEALGHRLHLVLGDAAVVEVMAQLFENRAEPWQRRATTRAQSDMSIEAEWDDPHNAATRHAETPALRPSNTAPVRTSTAHDLQKIAAAVANDARGSRDTIPVATLPAAKQPIPDPDPGASGAAQALLLTGDKPRTRTKAPESRPQLQKADLIDAAERPRNVTNSSGEVVAIGTPPRKLTSPSGEVAALNRPRARTPSKDVKKTAHIRVSEDQKRPSWVLWLAVVAALLAAAAVVVVLYLRDDDNTAVADPQKNPTQSIDAPPATKNPEPPLPTRGSSDRGSAAVDSHKGSATIVDKGSAKPRPGSADQKGSAGSAKKPTVRIRITSTPEATVVLDNIRLGRTPYEGEVPLDTGKHQLKVREQGYMVQIRDIRLDADVHEDFTMIRAAPP